MKFARCSAGLAMALMLGLAAPAMGQDKPVRSGKPAASKAANAKPAVKQKQAQARKPKPKPQVAKKPVAPKQQVARQPAPAKTPVASTRPSRPVVAAPAREPQAYLPPPLVWTPPPLGPERFYPNGIPELRPEFLHPLPSHQTSQAQ